LVYEERDVRSSPEALLRRRVATPTPGDGEEEAAVGLFLEFQGCR
jgi:hypothetical protein